MSKENKEEVKVLADIGKEDEPIRVSESVYKDTKYIDVRKMWTAPTGELAPTKKGIRFSEEHLPEIVSVLVDALDMNSKYELFEKLEGCIDEFEDEGEEDTSDGEEEDDVEEE